MVQRLDLDVSIYRDRVQVSDSDTGKFVDFRAERAFSSDYMLIADQTNLEHTLSHAIRKLLTGWLDLSRPRARIVSTEVPLTPAESTLLRTALNNTGFAEVIFDPEGEG